MLSVVFTFWSGVLLMAWNDNDYLWHIYEFSLVYKLLKLVLIVSVSKL